MSQVSRKNGFLEIRLNEDRTRALATIYPPGPGGEAIEVTEILDRLKAQGVMYGIREQAILEAVHSVKDTDKPAVDVVVAQGTLPQNGADAKIRYHLPLELLSKPLTKNSLGQPDWFALDREKLVKAGQELATIVPHLAGFPGKTLTWPIQTIAPKPGKPAGLTTGPNVRLAGEGTRLIANIEGYACLHNETLTVHALQCIDAAVSGGLHEFMHGAAFMGTLSQADVRSGGFIAVKGEMRNCFLRAHGDIMVSTARDCTIIATGSVYVLEGLVNCQVITPKKLICTPQSQIVGGSLCAKEGVEAGSLGSEDFAATEIIIGEDRYSSVRSEEIGEELTVCEANKERISQALKPFTSLTAHTQLTEDKRALLDKMQAQKRALEERANALHNERRTLMLASKSRTPGRIYVAHTAHPGVWLYIDSAALQVEVPMVQVEFVAAANGKAIQFQPVASRAAA